MKDIKQKLQTVDEIVDNNIANIKALIKQSEELEQVISHINDEEIKQSLEKIKNNIDHSLENLFEDTKKLFEQYKQLMSSL